MNIPGYRIVRKIGEGAMASVFLAVQTSLGRPVALKVLAPALAAQRGFTTRFLNEGRIIAYLKHPQIVDVYDLGSHEHDYYLAMEFLSAGTLEQRVEDGIGIAQSVRIVKQIATALGYAHQQGVIHRDIKPQNILFRDDGLPVLTDFGIARLIDGGPHLTIPGRALGSPLYMSPEQINGHRIDARGDLYSLGVLLYNMLTRKLPYESDQIMTIALMHKAAPIPVLPDDLAVFQPVLNSLLAKKPDDRFASAQELIDALKQIESKYPFSARETVCIGGVCRLSEEQLAAGKGGLLDACPTNSSDDFAPHTIGPALTADTVEQTLPAEDQVVLRPEQSSQVMKSAVMAASKGKPVWKRGAILGAVALVSGVGLTLVFFGMEPFMGLPRPSSHPVAVIKEEASWQPLRSHEPSNLQQPEQVLSIPGKGDLAGTTVTPVSDRTDVNQKIAELVVLAQKQLAQYRLTSPAGDNSYETYQQILALNPSSQAAGSIAIRIGEAYRKLALGAKDKGRLKQGLLYVGAGLKAQSEDPMLLALQAELRAGIAEQTRLKIDQAKKAEQQERDKAAARAALEEKWQAERELAEQHKQETERAWMKKQGADEKSMEKREEKIAIDPPGAENTGKEVNRQSHLFGTF